MSNIFNGIIRLRRDNDFNYDKIRDKFIPAAGEVCLVDTASRGLRAKVGDGKTVWANLEYADDKIYSAIDSVVVRGYYKDGDFYSDSLFNNKIPRNTNAIYINVYSNTIFTYNGEHYVEMGGKIPTASASVAGIMKLYHEMGQNTDGTMSQKAITDELNEKVEIQIDKENETIIFGNW